MTDYDNNMRGVLFKNKNKKSDKHPGYTGKCEINSKEWHVAGWVKRAKNGSKFLSLAFSEPREQKKEEAPTFDDLEDEDIPF